MTIITEKPSFQPVTLQFEEASEFADFFAALGAYSRKEVNAAAAVEALGLDDYSGNARRTVKKLVSELAEATGHTLVLPDSDAEVGSGSSRY